MGAALEEKQWIQLTLEECEKRILGLVYEDKGYELKNHQSSKEKAKIILESKVTFTSKGQRITCVLESEEKNTQVNISSELLLHTQKDRGENLKNIHQVFGALEGKITQKSEPDKKEKKKKSFWAKPEGQRECYIRIKATYLGGYYEMDKPLVGLLEVFSDGIEFAVVGPKFFIPANAIIELNNCSLEELLENSKWSSFCLKGGITKKIEISPKKKNIMVLHYQTEKKEESYCLFTSDSQLAPIENIEKVRGFINKMK